MTWHRPTWRYGTSYGFATSWRDVFGLFGEEARGRRAGGRPSRATKAEQMMARAGARGGFTLAELKRRYKALAKQHHPDLHGGDKAAEESLKLINEAYTYLRSSRLYV